MHGCRRTLVAVLASGLLVASAAVPARAQSAGTCRLSWNTCDPPVQNLFLGSLPSRVANLVLSCTDMSETNSGTEFTLILEPCPIGFPDAWRFDAAGCQTSARIQFRAAQFAKACPLLAGANASAVAGFEYGPDAPYGAIHLLNTYDPFTPTPLSRYTIWQVSFDHGTSDMVAPVEPDSCGGGSWPLCIPAITAHMLLSSGPRRDFDWEQSGFGMTVNMPSWSSCVTFCEDPTLTCPWGRVKALYH